MPSSVKPSCPCTSQVDLTCAQLINILTLGNPDGVGVFFPKGLGGAIKKPTGFDQMANGLDDFPATSTVASQVSLTTLERCFMKFSHC